MATSHGCIINILNKTWVKVSVLSYNIKNENNLPCACLTSMEMRYQGACISLSGYFRVTFQQELKHPTNMLIDSFSSCLLILILMTSVVKWCKCLHDCSCLIWSINQKQSNWTHATGCLSQDFIYKPLCHLWNLKAIRYPSVKTHDWITCIMVSLALSVVCTTNVRI